MGHCQLSRSSNFVSNEVASAAMPPKAPRIEPRRVSRIGSFEWYCQELWKVYYIQKSTRFVGACVTSSV